MLINENFLQYISENNDKHCRNSEWYKKTSLELEREITRIHYDNSNPNLTLGEIGNIYFPFFSMGKVTSANLFGLDEIIIFSFYLSNKLRYKRALDLGANIGLHSLILHKLDYLVTSYEPDPDHLAQFKLVMQLNEITDFNLVSKAVSNKKGFVDFVQIQDNSTGSHLSGSKESLHGNFKIINIESENINNILSENNFDLVKMDIEGHENVLIKSINMEFFEEIDFFLEIGSHKNAAEIFTHLIELNIPFYSQKINWKRISNLSEVPSHYSEGSCFISMQGPPNWGM
jgi:FkbM family methyltransferase